MRRLSALSFAFAGVLLSMLLVAHPESQSPAILFGSNSGTAKAVTVDSSGNMNVKVVSGAAPALTAGNGTGTFKQSGQLCSTTAANCSCTALTDAAVQNQWNVQSCTIPASTLATNGDWLEIQIDYLLAANANTKEFQMFWNGGTCSGTGAAMCGSGQSVWGTGVTTTSNATSATVTTRIERTSTGNQKVAGHLMASTAWLSSVGTSAPAVTDTNTIVVSFGGRNTSAAAATFGATFLPLMTVNYHPQ